MRERRIPVEQMGHWVRWLDTQPTVPSGRWFKRLPGMILCGEGELPKTFLTPQQLPDEIEIE